MWQLSGNLELTMDTRYVSYWMVFFSTENRMKWAFLLAMFSYFRKLNVNNEEILNKEKDKCFSKQMSANRYPAPPH